MASKDVFPSLSALGWNERCQALLADLETASGSPGRVVRHDGHFALVGMNRDVVRVRLHASTPRVAVGDWVLIDGETLVGLLPRWSLLQRRDPSTGDSQPIAANVDMVGIVCGMDRPVRLGRIMRFSSLAWDAGAAPLVILSKVDLVTETTAIANDILTAIPGAEIVTVSSTESLGVAELLARCADRTIVLVGESGSGKSTLLNALTGHDTAQTADVRLGDHKGRHTTTARELHVLDGHCRLIDTPGVREVGIYTDVETIDRGFTDIVERAVNCRFADCGHDTEPGCAVQDAVASGDLPVARLQAWNKLRREAASAELHADPAATRRADRQLGRLYRKAKETRGRNR